MDDIKILVKNEKEQETLIETIRLHSQDIEIEFGIEKWVMLVMKEKKETMKGIEQPILGENK